MSPAGNRNYMDDSITRARRLRQTETLQALYVSLGALARETFQIADLDEVAQLTGHSKNMVTDYINGLDRCNVIKAQTTRIPFDRPSDGQRIEVSKKEIWLFLPEDEALTRLNEVFEQEKRTGEMLSLMPNRQKAKKASSPVVRVQPAVVGEGEPEPNLPVALAASEQEETRAISGPEPKSPFAVLAPLRKDEYGALTEAARQYANRKDEVEKAIANLRNMGVEINETVLARAVKFPRDERMENICEILPYISRLEGQVENLTRQLVEAREKAVGFSELKRDNERLRQQLQRRIADSVNSSQR